MGWASGCGWGPHLRQKQGAGPAQSSGSWARASCAPGSGLFLFAAPQRVPGVARRTGREERGSPRVVVACEPRSPEMGDRFLLRNPPKVLWTKSLGRVLSSAHPSGVSPGSRTGVAQETFPPSLAPGQPWATTWQPGLPNWFLPTEALAWQCGCSWWRAELLLLWLGALRVPCLLGGQGGLLGSPPGASPGRAVKRSRPIIILQVGILQGSRVFQTHLP